jgi:predicted peroxiredoxin
MKYSRTTLVLLVAAIALMTVACNQSTEPVETPPPPPPRDGVFIHISHGPEDAHRVLMALTMAELMAADRDVLVYLDIHGIEVVLDDAPDIEYSHFASSHTQLAKLLELGVPIHACPGCLKAADKTAGDLAEGIQVADKEAFFGFTDGRILTLDY